MDVLLSSIKLINRLIGKGIQIFTEKLLLRKSTDALKTLIL